MQGHGLIDIADSMAALDTLVYREKLVSGRELKRALETRNRGIAVQHGSESKRHVCS